VVGRQLADELLFAPAGLVLRQYHAMAFTVRSIFQNQALNGMTACDWPSVFQLREGV